MSIRFDIITIFPKIFDSYFNESIMKRAREKKLVDIRVHNLRDFSRDKHKKVDDRPFGGGPGMVFKIEPLARALSSIVGKKSGKTKIVLLSAGGKQFTSRLACIWPRKYTHIVLVAGHYEGVDERIKKLFPMEEISVGPYVLTGGELPAMLLVDAISRHIPGVLGKEESLEELRYGPGMSTFTRPEIFVWGKKKYRVPPVLLSGDHKKIAAWRNTHRK